MDSGRLKNKEKAGERHRARERERERETYGDKNSSDQRKIQRHRLTD